MDNSQNSNIFSSLNISFNSSQMETMSYEDLVSRTKILLSKTFSQTECDSTFSSHFTTVLEDSGSCIFQALQLIGDILSNQEFEITDLKALMQDAVCLVHLLSNYLKRVVESVSMLCSHLNSFPTATGKIIFSVFMHCKESELLYGIYINQVQIELKDLFRNCHELQITYLMILEKHFIFDLSDRSQLDVLIDGLEINLQIGEIVQMLDVKTMAEQWKAYTMICEKHGESIMNHNIFNKTTTALCIIVQSNLKTAFENSEDEKLILRSIKIASFMIKILIRICNIFKQSNVKNYKDLIEMLLYINLNNSAYLEAFGSKSQQFINTIYTQITVPTQGLIQELLPDTDFIHSLLQYNVPESNDDLLGIMILMTSIMTASIGRSNIGISKHTILKYVFKLVSNGHICFNIGLKFNNPIKDKVLGLYEYLLSCSIAFCATFSSTEFGDAEKTMFENILSTDLWTALFASDLLVMLSRFHNKLVNQVVSLCDTLKKLENNIMYYNSPQQIHLTYTIQRLHRNLSDENKIIVQRQLTSRNLLSLENTSLWSVLEIKELPKELKQGIENTVTKKLKSCLQNINAATIKTREDVYDLIKTLKVAATCSYYDYDHHLEDAIVKTWSKACCKISRNLCIAENIWYLHFMEALVLLTMNYKARNNMKYVQVLHVISSILDLSNKELKLVMIDPLLKLSQLNYGSHKKTTHDYLIESFRKLTKENDVTVKTKFLTSLRKYSTDKNTQAVIWQAVDASEDLENLDSIMDVSIKLSSLKEILKESSNFRFVHKCIEIETREDVIELSNGSLDSKRTNSNFDFADIDTLFDTESDLAQPESKKPRLESKYEVNDIILKLESDVNNLCLIKENILDVEHKSRIMHLCEKLRELT